MLLNSVGFTKRLWFHLTELRKHLQRPVSNWCLGMFWWVQPNFNWSIVRHCCSSEIRPRCNQRQEEPIHFSRGGNLNRSYCWYLHHNESWLCRQNWTPWEPQVIVQVCKSSTFESSSHWEGAQKKWYLDGTSTSMIRKNLLCGMISYVRFKIFTTDTTVMWDLRFSQQIPLFLFILLRSPGRNLKFWNVLLQNWIWYEW